MPVMENFFGKVTFGFRTESRETASHMKIQRKKEEHPDKDNDTRK
jgi:hypothetical protein